MSEQLPGIAGLASGIAVGLVVPSANPAVEPEMARLLPPAFRLHAARLPVMPGTTLEQRNHRYPGLYQEAIAGFGGLKLAHIAIGLTGASYKLGVAGDRALCDRLSGAAGTKVITASLALYEALTALGAKRIALVSPYPAWLTEAAAQYWTGAGFAVSQIVKASETFRAYEMAVDEVSRALAQVDEAGADAVVLSGTGMMTLPSILARAGSSRVPCISSNMACAWSFMRGCGAPDRSVVLDLAAPPLTAALALASN